MDYKRCSSWGTGYQVSCFNLMKNFLLAFQVWPIFEQYLFFGLLTRNSDSPSIRARMKCKARQSGYNSSKTRLVNFVIFVVNGLSVLKSIDSCDDGASQFYIQTIAEMFCCPYLSFRGTAHSLSFACNYLMNM